MKLLAPLRRWWHHTSNTLATPLLVKASDAPIWRVFFFAISPIFPALRRKRYSKQALSFDDQVTLLEQRGVTITDRSRAIQWLSRTNYYRFSAYLYPFRTQNDLFQPGTTFDQICAIYNFDRKLRLHVMDSVERVEIWIRTAITYEIAHVHGPFGHLKNKHFTKGFAHKEFVARLREEQSRSKETFVEHYFTKYDGENDLPIWMASELLTLGTLSHIFSALPLDSKKRIALPIQVDHKVLGGWLHSIGYVRNICAHHGRLWNRVLAIRPRCPSKWAYGRIDNEKIYLLLVVLHHITSQIAPDSTWTERFIKLLDESPMIDASAMGFPLDWRNREPWNSQRASAVMPPV